MRAFNSMGRPEGFGYPGGMMSGGRIAMMILILFLAGTVIYLLLKEKNRKQDKQIPPPGNGDVDQALRILNERFVRGEISEEEYLHKKSILLDRI